MIRRLECADCGKLLARYDDTDPIAERDAKADARHHECPEQRRANRDARKNAPRANGAK